MDTANQLNIPIVHSDLLMEKKVSEHLYDRWLIERCQTFVEWLVRRQETVIVIVSHSAYLRCLMQTPNYFPNCTLWSTAIRFQKRKRNEPRTDNGEGFQLRRYSHEWDPPVKLIEPSEELRQVDEQH